MQTRAYAVIPNNLELSELEAFVYVSAHLGLDIDKSAGLVLIDSKVFSCHPFIQMLEIFDHMLREVKQRLISLGICLEVSESVKNLVCQRGYDQTYGARQLRRAINSIIEDVLVEAILSGNLKPGDTAVVDLNTFGNPFVINLSDHGTHPVSDSKFNL